MRSRGAKSPVSIQLIIVLFLSAGRSVDLYFLPRGPWSLATLRARSLSRLCAFRDAINGNDGVRVDRPRDGDRRDAVTADGEESPNRRRFLRASSSSLAGAMSVGVLCPPPWPTTAAATATENNAGETDAPGLSDRILRSLVFERVLGSGSYKTVYLVSSAAVPATEGIAARGEGGSMGTAVQYALAVERLRTARDVTNAFRGVRIPEAIRGRLGGTERELFEDIVDWWIQPSDVPEFAPGRPVISIAHECAETNSPVDLDGAIGRTRTEPRKNFSGSRWMLSFKPVYENDLARFIIRTAPLLSPVGETSGNAKLEASLDSYWTEQGVMTFVLEMLHAGRLMHEAGIVHRDIKPKNVMMVSVPSSSGIVTRPVIIDYGYAEFGSLLSLGKNVKDICVVHAGQLKGEAAYVIAKDLKNYRGCQRGDAYAMGKTVYEFAFGSADWQAEQGRELVISVEAAVVRNKLFRGMLFNNDVAAMESRFPLSRAGAECLLSVARGLCGTLIDGQERALSFAEAEEIILKYLAL